MTTEDGKSPDELVSKPEGEATKQGSRAAYYA